MSKDKISDYSATANSNTDIAGINIDEGCAPSGINNAIRTLMKQLKDFQQGTNSDPFNGPVNGTVGATTPAAGTFTTLTASGNVVLGDASTDTLNVGNGGLIKDSSGNLGLGVTPSAWSGYKALQVGATASLFNTSGSTVLSENYYVAAGGATYITSNFATAYTQVSGQHRWYNAASGTAGAAITFTQAMTLDASGKLLIGTTSAITGPYWGTASNLYVTGTYGVGSFSSFVNSNSGGGLVFQKSRNTTVGSHTIVQNNDFLMDISIEGSDGSAFRSAAGISCQVDGSTISASSMPGRLVFSTTASGSVSATERARIDSSGNLLVTSTGGLGYGTGSGGAVTQATSRTTGVTLNKTNGAITLISAAGSTSWQSFTVTNSTVAATDVVHVSQKSGTDLYEIHVTAVAAGSFRISFKTTAGTTTEQPVFNFAVIKAVTA